MTRLKSRPRRGRAPLGVASRPDRGRGGGGYRRRDGIGDTSASTAARAASRAALPVDPPLQSVSGGTPGRERGTMRDADRQGRKENSGAELRRSGAGEPLC